MNNTVRFLYQPVNPYHVGQRFGQNLACIDNATGKVIAKARSDTPCPAGTRNLYGPGGHPGLDLKADEGQPVYASQDGIVEEVQTEIERGLGVGIVTHQKYWCNETASEEQFKYRNWHFSAISVKRGQKVRTGDLIGYAGSTGYSTAAHDHFEVKPVRYDLNGTPYNILQDNSTYGAVDPMPLMIMEFALTVSKKRYLMEQISLALERLAEVLRQLQQKWRTV